ncbi:Cacna1h [Symbiodinium sp. CCMP2456]|nr:Cacna1h [Symbiodinium sp. CCMP2456]
MQKLRRQELLLNELLVKRPGGLSLSTSSTPKRTTPHADSAESPTSSRSSRLHRPRRPSGGSFTPTLFVSYTEQDMEVKAGASEVHGTTIRRRFASMRAENPADTGTADSILSRSCRGVYRTIAAIVHSTYFDAFFTLVVVANTAFIGFDVQYTIWNDGVQPAFFYTGNYVFSAIFAVELFLRLYVERWALYCGEDWMWGWLDTFIVFTAVWDIVVDVWMASQEGAESVADMSGLRAFRIIRITRIVKAVRLMRIFRFVMALRMLVSSIVNTLKSLFWALVLLILIVYVFGVIFSQAVNDFLQDQEPGAPSVTEQGREVLQARFGTVLDAMLSLFMSITDGISYVELLTPLSTLSGLWIFVFLFYMSFTYFAVLNVVTGVFCHSAIESAQNDHAAVVQSILENKETHMRKLRQLFSKFNADTGSDELEAIITFPMFEEKINTPAVREYFESLNLDVWDAWSFFKLLDLDQGGAVSVDEFLMGCLRFRGAARAMDVGKLLHDQNWLIKAQSRFQGHAEVEFQELKMQMNLLIDALQGEGAEHVRRPSTGSVRSNVSVTSLQIPT